MAREVINGVIHNPHDFGERSYSAEMESAVLRNIVTGAVRTWRQVMADSAELMATGVGVGDAIYYEHRGYTPADIRAELEAAAESEKPPAIGAGVPA